MTLVWESAEDLVRSSLFVCLLVSLLTVTIEDVFFVVAESQDILDMAKFDL